MTDLEKFIDTYSQMGIDLNIDKSQSGILEITLSGYEEMSNASHKFGGYNGFHSTVIFTKEGKFIEQNFWE